MDQEALIQETNALLKQLLELEASRKRESEAALADIRAKFPTPSLDLPQTPAPKTEDFLGDHREKLEELRRVDNEYKQAVLNEYREQTKLLTEILQRMKS